MNVPDIVILVILAAAVIAAVAFTIRNKKKGRSCCGNCAECSAMKNCKDK